VEQDLTLRCSAITLYTRMYKNIEGYVMRGVNITYYKFSSKFKNIILCTYILVCVYKCAI